DPRRDPDRRALPGVQVALRGQLVIDRSDDAARDAELGRKPTARWKSRPGGEPSLPDRGTQPLLELLVERLIGASVEFNKQANWPFRIGHNWNCTESQLGTSLLGHE